MGRGKFPVRKGARGWLQSDLAAYTKLLQSGKPADRTLVRQRLQHWQRDTDLAGIRDPGALAKLPESERKEWVKFWAEVATAMKKSG